MVTSAGQVFVPRGFTLSTLQYTQPYLDGANAYSSVLSETEAQIDAIAGAWHGNIVRLQIEQDELVRPRGRSRATTSYLNLIRAVVSYAKAKGLVVVLNAQTEPGAASAAPRTSRCRRMETVKFWQILAAVLRQRRQRHHRRVQRAAPGRRGTSVRQYMKLWKDGGRYQGATYLGHQAAGGNAPRRRVRDEHAVGGAGGQRRARGP